MDAKLKGLFDQRASETEKGRAFQKRAVDEKRELTSEEVAQRDAHIDKAMALTEEIEAYQRSIETERKLVELELRVEKGDLEIDPGKRGLEQPGDGKTLAVGSEMRSAFSRWVALARGAALGEKECRALQAESLTGGGALVLPMALAATLVKFIDDMTFVRGLANVLPLTSAESLGAPALDTDASDADWTGEVSTVAEDSSMAFGRRELNPRPLAKLLKVSAKLLRLAPEAGTLVLQRLAYKQAVSQEKAFLTGTGANQPLGVFTASAQGISTGRDVSTGNTSTAVTAAGLVNAKYGLKGGYWRNASWIFHRDILKQVANLIGADNQFLWRQSLRDGEPDTLLGRPVYMSEFAPNTSTSGLYVGIFGDFQAGYMIADSLAVTIQRLNELFALNNQVGFVSRSETDGMPVLEEAFVRVKLG